MIDKPCKIAGVFLVLLVLLLSTVSAEARTFRKAVSNSDPQDLGAQIDRGTGAQISNSEPQTADCEPTIKRVRGKRVVSNSCQPSAIGGQPKNDNPITGFQTFSNPQLTTQNSQPFSNTIIVLNTNDVAKTKEAVNLIRQNGGVVSIVYIPNTLVVLKLPNNVESTLVSKYGATISKSGIPNRAAPALVNALSAPQASSSKPQTNYEFKEGEVKIAPDRVNTLLVPPGSSGYPPPSDPTRTSEYMIGDVFVSVILPESDGTIDTNVDDWNVTEETIVDQQVANALNWWVDRSLQYSTSYQLTFWTYPQHYKVNTAYEPSHRPQSNEGLWVNDVLNKIGIPSAGDHITRVRNYDNFLRTNANGTYDWAFTVFAIDTTFEGTLNNDHAYLGGPFEVVGYGWRPDESFGLSIAHETGHIFWALDQYIGSGEDCPNKAGLLLVENQNYAAGCSMNDPNTIMRGGTSSLSTTTHDPYGAGQIGWRDADSDSVTDSIDITYNTWDIDTDSDQIINYWDIDDDADGINDVNDYCPLSPGTAGDNGCSYPTVSVSSDKATAQIGEVVRVTTTASDNFKTATLSIFVDGVNQSGTVCSGIGTASANCYKDLTFAAAGSHNFYSTATDDNNLTTTATQSFTVQPDSGNPTVTVSAPATVQVNTPIRITSSSTDNAAVSSISIFVDGASQTGLTCSGLGTASANCYKDYTPTSVHAYTFYSVATDSSSNTARDPVSGTKSFNVVDTTAPTVSVSAPASVNIGQLITITGTASDNYQLSEITVYLDGALVKTCSGGATTCDFQTSFGAPGTHNYYAVAKDSSGNSAQSTTKSFDVVDNIAPTFTEPITVNSAGSSVTIIAKAADNIQLSEIKIFLDGSLVKTCPVSGTSGQCDYSASLTYGTHKTYAVATDSAGNTATHPEKVFDLKDNIPPNGILSYAGTSDPSEGKRFAITITANDDGALSSIAIYRSGANSPVKTCASNSKTATCEFRSNWGYEGRNSRDYYAVVTDKTGNTVTVR